MKNLIIIGGGHLQVPLIQKSSAMGIRSIVFDVNEHAQGMQICDQPIKMSTHDIDGCVRTAKTLKNSYDIHGVITVGTDASMAVAAIANALNLPGNRYSSAKNATNKVLMRTALQKHKLAVPTFQAVWSLSEARQAVLDKIGLPAVLKPAENMGSRGVIKINSHRQLMTAIKEAKMYAPTGEMIIEKYLPGPELSVDALVFKNKIWITGVADRIFSNNPHYFIEFGHNMPSQLPLPLIQEAEDTMKQAMRALEITTGGAKGDLKLTPQGFYIGEIAARLSGGFMSSHTYPLASNVDLYSAAIRIALGNFPFSAAEERIIEERSYLNGTAIERSICVHAGKISELQGIEEIQAKHGIKHVYIKRNKKDIVPILKNNLDKLGHIVAVGKTVAEAELKIQQALSQSLKIEIDRSYGIHWPTVEKNARARFGSQICWVCKICDGQHCASGVPGMGGIGKMNSFKDNITAFQEIKILPEYIREHNPHPDCSVELFGRILEHPIMGAPLTGTTTNMKLNLSEYTFAKDLLSSYRENGSIAWVGDGASPKKFKEIAKAVEEEDGFAIIIFKPRSDVSLLQERFAKASALNAVAIGMDIDAIGFKTMRLKNQSTSARDLNHLRMIREMTPLPFILKGIMSPRDAQLALEVGADCIVVSNHGGRVLDDMPGTARVLARIVATVKQRIPVIVDGGIRSGEDVCKAISLGANAVLVGRPSAIAVVGGGKPAVHYLLNDYRQGLLRAMQLCGAKNLNELSPRFLFNVATKEPIIKTD